MEWDVEFVGEQKTITVIAGHPFKINTHEFGITSEEFYATVDNIPEFFEGKGFEDLDFSNELDSRMILPFETTFETVSSKKPKCGTGASLIFNPKDCDRTNESNPEESILVIMEDIIHPFLEPHQKFVSQVQKEELVNVEAIHKIVTNGKNEHNPSIESKSESNSSVVEERKPSLSGNVKYNTLAKNNSKDDKKDQHYSLKKEKPSVEGNRYDSKSDYVGKEDSQPNNYGESDDFQTGVTMEVYETNYDYQPYSQIKDFSKKLKTNGKFQEGSWPISYVEKFYETTNETYNKNYSNAFPKIKESNNCGRYKCDSSNSGQEVSDSSRSEEYYVYEKPTKGTRNKNNNKILKKNKESKNCGQHGCDLGASNQEETISDSPNNEEHYAYYEPKKGTNYENYNTALKNVKESRNCGQHKCDSVQEETNDSRHPEDQYAYYVPKKETNYENYNTALKNVKESKNCSQYKCGSDRDETNDSRNPEKQHTYYGPTMGTDNENDNILIKKIKESNTCGNHECGLGSSGQEKVNIENNVYKSPTHWSSSNGYVSKNSKEFRDFVRQLFSLKQRHSKKYSKESEKTSTDHNHSTSPTRESKRKNNGNTVNNVATFLSGLTSVIDKK